MFELSGSRSVPSTDDIHRRIKARYEESRYRTMVNRLHKVRLKKLLLYSGSDPEIQEHSLVALALLLGYYVDEPHRQIIRHQNLTQFGDRKKDLTLAFRGMGKSTVGNYTRAIAYILRNFNVRALVTSDTDGAARAFVDEIVAHLLYNGLLTEMFGAFFYPRAKSKIGRYGSGEATIAQRSNRTHKEATLTSIGTGGQSASRHFDVIFADDLVTDETARTPTQRANLESWHGSTLIGTALPNTKYHYIGTRYYKDDLYDVLETGAADQKAEGGSLRGAVLRLRMVEEDQDGNWVRSNYPDRYPLNVCREYQMAMGRYHFNAQMQQDTTQAEGLVFDYSDFRWYGPGYNQPPESGANFNYSDLCAKKTEVRDFHATVTITVAKNADGNFNVWVRDLQHKRAGMKKQREIIWSAFQKWRPIEHGIEAVQMQAGFAEEIAERTMLPFIPDPVTKDKVWRARRVAPLVENGRVYFPSPDTPEGRTCNALVDELQRFDGDPKNHDDCVDAFVGAVTMAILGNWHRGNIRGMMAEQMESMTL